VVSVSAGVGVPDLLLGLLLDFGVAIESDDVEGTTCEGIARLPVGKPDTDPVYATALSFKLATRKERYCPTLGTWRM
jgi:hypothetical protein